MGRNVSMGFTLTGPRGACFMGSMGGQDTTAQSTARRTGGEAAGSVVEAGAEAGQFGLGGFSPSKDGLLFFHPLLC